MGACKIILFGGSTHGSDFAGSETDEVLEYRIDKDQCSVSSLQVLFCETGMLCHGNSMPHGTTPFIS